MKKKIQEQTDSKGKVLESIKTKGKGDLTHVDTVDKSKPVIEPVPVRKNVHGKVMEEIQKVEPKELKHVQTVDKAKPVIDEDAHVKQSPHPKLMNEVRKLSERRLNYEASVADSQKVPDQFKNKEGSDLADLGLSASQKKKFYEENAVQKSSDSAKNNDSAELAGVARRVKEQYEKEVEEKTKSPEGTMKEKEGDKVVYKNLPPKKELNELI